MSDPRKHHYIFAHQALPGLFHANPDKFIELVNQAGPSLINEIWQQLAEELEPADRLPADGLGCELKRLSNDTLVALITLPAPLGMTEAYFIALAYRPEVRRNLLFKEKDAIVRFITLENGFTLDNEPRTVLCEWTKEAHLNRGDGPPPTLEAFSIIVEEILSDL